MSDLKLAGGQKKAEAFCNEANGNGWTTSTTIKNGDEIHVEATRNKERITIWWRGNSLVETPFHHYMGEVRSLHNKADATRQLSKKPMAKKVRAASVGRRFSSVNLDPKTGEVKDIESLDLEDLKEDLPFSLDDSDPTILKALRGSTIIFINRVSGHAESVHIPKQLNMDLNKFNLEESVDGKLYVNFLAATGFRSVYIDSILRVM